MIRGKRLKLDEKWRIVKETHGGVTEQLLERSWNRKIWSMLKKMSENKVELKTAVLQDEGIMTMTHQEKTQILGKKIGDHLKDIHRQNKERL